jgi:hypothetical protein
MQCEQAAVISVQDAHSPHYLGDPGILVKLFVRPDLAPGDLLRTERIHPGIGLIDRRTHFTALPVDELVVQNFQEPGPMKLDTLKFVDALESLQANVLYQVLRI